MNNNIDFPDYGCYTPGCIRKITPNCKKQIAVIPAVTVDTVAGIKGLAACFVHVDNINTTYYIDDKHRMMIVWAGPVEADDYDYVENPLNLRSQTVYDLANNRAIFYGKTGTYKVITLS